MKKREFLAGVLALATAPVLGVSAVEAAPKYVYDEVHVFNGAGASRILERLSRAAHKYGIDAEAYERLHAVIASSFGHPVKCGAGALSAT